MKKENKSFKKKLVVNATLLTFLLLVIASFSIYPLLVNKKPEVEDLLNQSMATYINYNENFQSGTVTPGEWNITKNGAADYSVENEKLKISLGESQDDNLGIAFIKKNILTQFKTEFDLDLKNYNGDFSYLMFEDFSKKENGFELDTAMEKDNLSITTKSYFKGKEKIVGRSVIKNEGKINIKVARLENNLYFAVNNVGVGVSDTDIFTGRVTIGFEFKNASPVSKPSTAYLDNILIKEVPPFEVSPGNEDSPVPKS